MELIDRMKEVLKEEFNICSESEEVLIVKNVAAVLVLFLVWQEKYLPRS